MYEHVTYIYNRIYTLLVQLYQTWIGGHPSFSVCRCCPLLLSSGDRVTPEMGMAALAQKSIWQESWCQHLPTNTSLWQHSTKGVFSPVQNASGVENPHIFLNIEHCKWQQRVPHSFAAIAAIAMLFRKGCVLSWVRQKVSQVSKIASSCFKNLNNPGNPNRATHYRYLQIVFIFTSDGLQQSHVFLCASVALETRRGNFAPPPPWDF